MSAARLAVWRGRADAHALAAAAIVGVGLLACLFRLGAPSFWLDEAISDGFTRMWWTGLWREILADGGNQGLYYVLLSGWKLLGGGDAWLRLLSVVFAGAALVVFYRLALRLFGARVALVALALMAVNPFFVRFAREVRGYSLSLLLVTASTLVLVDAVQRGGTRRWAAYGALCVLSVWTHLFGMFFIAGQAASLLVLGARHIPWRALLPAAAGAAVFILPVAVHALTTGTEGDPYLDTTSLNRVRAVAASLAGDRGEWAGAVIAVAWALGLLAVALMFKAQRRGPQALPWALVLGITAVPVGLALAVAFLGAPIVKDRYFIAVLPGACLLAALGFQRVVWRPVVTAALVFVLAVSAFRIVEVSDAHHQGENWRGIVAQVLAEAGPSDRFVFFAAWMTEAFKYYLRKAGPAEAARLVLMPDRGWVSFHDAPLRNGFFDAEDLAALCEGRADPLWLVIHDARGPLPLEEMERAVERTHFPASERAYSIIRVRRYEPLPASNAAPSPAPAARSCQR